MKVLFTLFITACLINIAVAQEEVPIAAYDHDLAQKDSKFIYPGYILKIHNFNVFNDKEGEDGTNYNGDLSKVILFHTIGATTTVRVKKDSLVINDDPEHGLDISVIEIIPSHKSDSFKLYYSYPVQLQKIIKQKSYDTDDTRPVSSLSLTSTVWRGATNYKQLAPEKTLTYKMPKIDYTFYETPGGWIYEEIKTRLQLKEKAIVDKIAHDHKNALVYKNNPCLLNPQGICFRVERYVNGKFKSTKYLLIEFQDYD